MKNKYCILDCFVDEPACFGVPPFISPYPRYVCGALIDAKVDPADITYLTIDTLRENNYVFDGVYDAVFVIGGAVVPGRYLGAKIGTISEIHKIMSNNPRLRFIIGGPAAAAFSGTYENALPVSRDIEAYAHTLARGRAADCWRSSRDTARWATLGAFLVKKHPVYPDIICEIETYRGCPRLVHCTFCSEGLIDGLDFRLPSDILAEIDTLTEAGVTRFRLGAQTDILQYMTPYKDFINGFPKPESSAVIELFGELKRRRLNGAIHTLNIDNANPGTIANFPDESKKMLAAIVEAVSPGDTVALGIESFDKAVIAKNNLKVSPEQARFVIELINEIGGKKINGSAVLLPGINLIHALAGETAETFAINYRTLSEITEAGLLLKRINIRKHLPFPNTALAKNPVKISASLTKRFEFYRRKIRDEIDAYMLKKIYAIGTIIPELMVLEHRDGYSLGKQIASYSITAKLPVVLEKRTFNDVIVTGHRQRSLEVLPLPIDINTLPQKGLEFIRGISKRNSPQIILNRPFATKEDFSSFLAVNDINIDREIMQNIHISEKT